MIPYAIDPSLHSAEPEQACLDDGFSPRSQGELPEPVPPAPRPSLEQALASKSDF
jgi:hypothetical protein